MTNNNETQYNNKKNVEDYNYKQIINLGKAFLEAAKKCDDKKRKYMGWSYPLLVPFITNMVFSCELFLKAILKHDNKKIKEHNLEQLFKKLQEDVKIEIMKPQNEKDFIIKLKNVSNLFMEWRYLYEYYPTSVDCDFLCDFSEKLLKIADNM